MSLDRSPRATLEAIFRAALAGADPAKALRRGVARVGGALWVGGRPLPDEARLLVVGAGKAAAPMAAELERLAHERIADGLVVTKPGHGLRLRRLALREAGHPLPDARSERAAREVLALVSRARPADVLVVLLSGGASALLACPLPGLTHEDLRVTTTALLRSGAEIGEVNAIRKHLVELAGGRLARRAACRRIEALVISDVPGDRLDVIASGPCTPDPTTFGDALRLVEERGLRAHLPARVVSHLEAGARGQAEETPKPGDPALAGVTFTPIASNRDALQGARRESEALGLRVGIVTESLAGEARVAGRRLAALGRAAAPRGPLCLLAGGETTVTVRGPGRGGRSQELALAAALGLAGSEGVALLAAGTDGSDGPTDAAGAYADGETVARAAERGMDAVLALERNDSHAFFRAEGGLVWTGPTRTNVMDLVLVLARPQTSRR